MKKRISVFLIVIIMLSIMVVNVSAVDIIAELNCWYSDYSGIAHWNASVGFSSVKTQTCPSSHDSNVTSGYSAWSLAGIPCSGGSGVAVTGGPYNEIKVVLPSFPPGATGHTAIAATQMNGVYITPSGNKNGYIMSSAAVYIATDRSNIKTYKHEIGHALGWFGHSSNSSDIMYYSSTSIVNLTPRDINHLYQVIPR